MTQPNQPPAVRLVTEGTVENHVRRVGNDSYTPLGGKPTRNPLTGMFHTFGDPLIDHTGTTDSTTRLNAYITAARSAGGGTVLLGKGTIRAEPTMKHRVTLQGCGKRETEIRGVPGSAKPGVIDFEVGYNQATWIKSLSVSSPNDGQHGVYAYGRPLPPDNNGGWWEGGMKDVQIHNLTGAADCIRFDADTSGDNLLPHQFLTFDQVFCFATPTGRCIASLSQSGQFTFIGGQFDGAGPVAGGTESVYLKSGYTWVFNGTTFQSNLTGVHLAGAQSVVFNGCYWETLGFALKASNHADAVLINPRFSNAGFVAAGDNTGRLIKATDFSTIEVQGGSYGGSASRTFEASPDSTIHVDGFYPPRDQVATTVGFSKQVVVSAAGVISPPQGTRIAFVNSSPVPITTLNASFGGLADQELVLMAYQGPLTFSESNVDDANNIRLGGRGTPLTVPRNSFVTLRKMDAVYGWVVTNISPEPSPAFPCTVDPGIIRASDGLSVPAANAAVYMRVADTGRISKIGLQVAVTSGNISVAVHRNNGIGRASVPGAQVSKSGSVACPPNGYAEIPLDAEVTVYAGDWFAISADNVTAKFSSLLAQGMDSGLGAGRQCRLTNAHPLPASPSGFTSTIGYTICLVGVM